MEVKKTATVDYLVQVAIPLLAASSGKKKSTDGNFLRPGEHALPVSGHWVTSSPKSILSYHGDVVPFEETLLLD